MTVKNEELVQAFLDFEENRMSRNSSGSLKFIANSIYSYDTLIGRYEKSMGLLLVADEGLSTTSSRHRNLIVNSAIERGIKIATIPVRRGSKEFPTNKEVLNAYESRMDRVSMGTELATATNRKIFKREFDRYKEFADMVGETPKDFKRYEELNEKIENTAFIAELTKQRKAFMASKDKLFRDTVSSSEYFG